ncbi:MAG: hypothetical protein ACK445_11975 [Bacteroidota bacterium]|jgi:hypothetical protein
MNINARLFIILIAILTGCAAHFDRYPGERLSSIPVELHGEYYFHEKPSFLYMFKKDSAAVRIMADRIMPIPGSKAGGEPLILGDTVVFSKFGKYYAMSQRDENIPNAWTVSVVRADKNNLYIYSIEENADYSEKLVKLFVSETYVRQADGSYKRIVVPNEVKMRNLKHSASDTTVVFKMGEESLNFLFEKYVSKEKPLHLRRVK